MDTTRKNRLIICFINPKLGLEGWKNAKIFKSEKLRIEKLLNIDENDALIFWDSPRGRYKLNNYSQIIFYAPSVYSVYHLIIFWLQHFRYRGKVTSILRVGYFPTKTHWMNQRYYAFLKAFILEIAAGMFFNKIFLVSGNRNTTIFNRNRIEEIPQTVNRKMFAQKQKLGIREKRLVTFVGRLETEKGAHLLENIMIPDVDIIVVGDGSYKSNLNTKSHLILKGVLQPKQLSEIYAKSYAVLNLSPSEGVPKALIEACANGCFVIYFKNAFEIPKYCEKFCIPINHLADAKNKYLDICDMMQGIERIREYYGE